MKTINFYRQARLDGGKRTGIEIDDETVMEQFEEGAEMEDSALLWFVDIRCSGAELPNDPESARAWLMEKAPAIQQGINAVATELQAGIDPSAPVSRTILNMGAGVTVKIVCSAIRRLPALKIAEALKEISAHWQEFLSQLKVLEPLGH